MRVDGWRKWWRRATGVGLPILAVLLVRVGIVQDTVEHGQGQVADLIRRAHEAQAHDLDELRERVLRRFALYEELIEREMLEGGMVVSRDVATQRPLDVCDSLLFSALRYAALYRVMPEKADAAWAAIRKAAPDGTWRRHTACADRATSRDMLIGVLAAQASLPPEARDVTALGATAAAIERSGGYISPGVFHVSMVTPGLGRILGELLNLRSNGTNDVVLTGGLPSPGGSAFTDFLLRRSFRTYPLDSLFLTRGFVSHLQALAIFSETALAGQDGSDAARAIPIERFFSAHLVGIDSQNLFFQYLALRASGRLDEPARHALLARLDAMPEFPRHRLPTRCDRWSDYLWQRDSAEWSRRLTPDQGCGVRFPGVDFLWLSSLLLP